MADSVVRERSYGFALAIIGAHRYLVERREFILSKQMLRSGTAIGANIEEALAGYSRADFAAKMSVASKEARECHYWLRLLLDSGSLEESMAAPLLDECGQLIRMLTAIVKTAQHACE